MSTFGTRLRILSSTKDGVYYSDVDSQLKRDYRDNDLLVVTNTSAVQQSMAGIIATRKGERPFDPYFGCDIHASLFENMNFTTAIAVERSIYDAIGTYEPRVQIHNVDVTPIYDKNEYMVVIYYKLITNLNNMYQLIMEINE